MKTKSSTLGQFLLALLHSYGVEHAHGVDGDAVIRIRKEFDTFEKIQNITCVHESTAAFSAEVYGRIKQLGMVYATYNAGINNTLNAVDEGHLHNSALVVIGGEPSMNFRKSNPCLHHHQLRYGEFDDQLQLMKVKLGKDRAISITDLKTAAENIAVMVGKAIRDRLPVYIGVPSDLWDKTISYNEDKIARIRQLYDNRIAKPNGFFFRMMLTILKYTISKMKRPMISVGHGVKEFDLLRETIHFAENLEIPVSAQFNGFGAFPVDHPLFVGTYNGPASVPPGLREFTEKSERIEIGVLETDLNRALQTDTVKLPRAKITFDPRKGRIQIGLIPIPCNARAQEWLLRYMAERLEPSVRQTFTPFISWVKARDDEWGSSQSGKTNEERIRVADIAPLLNDFLKNRDMPIVADVGDAMFITLSILPSLPSRITYASVFAAMGIFAGCIGLEHATGKRPLVLVGDGAFCMGETYSLTLTGAKPIIIILNNYGWSMMRQLRGGNSTEKNGNDSLLWPRMHFHADRIVNTAKEFEAALETASAANAQFVIDVRLLPNDKSEPLLNFKDVQR